RKTEIVTSLRIAYFDMTKQELNISLQNSIDYKVDRDQVRRVEFTQGDSNCYQVQCTTGATALPGGSSYSPKYYSLACLRMLLLLSGDVELNPGPRTDKPTKAALMKIFGSLDHHFMTIGAGLEVKTADLDFIAGPPNTKLQLVFQRWFDAGRDISWARLEELCDEFPDELGKAKSEVQAYIGLAETQAAAGEGKTKSDDQKSDSPPDVSKYYSELGDIERKIKGKKMFKELTTNEMKFIEEVHLILVTATTIEYCAVMGATEPTGEDGNYIKVVTNDGSANFILGKFGPCNVAITRTGQGPDETEDILVSIQKDVKAKYVIAIGICYGANKNKTKELSDKTNLGDIIVAKSIIDTAHQRIEGRDTIVLPTEHKCGKNIYKLFKHDEVFEIENKPVKVHHQGSLASEFTLFRNKEAKEEKLKYVQQALGGEMEAKGIYKAGERGGFEWIVIKAIVDWGTIEKDKKWQPFGAVSCARFVQKCLKDSEQPGKGDPLKELSF
uniref:Nucleoside phosphorylase domain-containing protein n=1 Tax=Amphimedon queenslandica TaxID=400682 RepID=A0A1X7TK72_AMPQE